MKKSYLFLIVCFLIAFAPSARCDLSLNSVTRTGRRITERGRVAVSQGRLQIEEAKGETAPLQSVLLIHAVREEVSLMDHASRRYTVMPLSVLRGMTGQFKGILDLLPPEQRNAAAGYLNQKPLKLSVTRLGKTLNIQDLTCDGYVISSDGSPAYEVWMVPDAVFPENAADLRTLRKILKILTELAEAMPGEAGEEGALVALDRIEGVPLRIRKIGAPGSVTEIHIETKRVDPERFRPPAGYECTPGLFPGL